MDQDITVIVDSSKIKLILKNIISNAYDEMAPGNTIRFASKELDSNQVELSIFNTGSYLKEDLRKKIFDIYFTTKKKGNGLGLALSRKIVRDHGGEIICKSFEDHGTGFYISLPMGKSEAKKAINLPKSSQDLNVACYLKDSKYLPAQNKNRYLVSQFLKSNDLTVLLVDDEEVYQSYVENMMSSLSEKIKMYRAKDYNEAQKIILGQDISVAIIDQDLGRESKDGISIIKMIRELQLDIILCLHSNNFGDEVQKKAIEAGSDLFLLKPAAEDHLANLFSIRINETKRRCPIFKHQR